VFSIGREGAFFLRGDIDVAVSSEKFGLTQIDRVKKLKENNVTLIKYYWFEDDLIFIDYINNDPDDIKIETVNTKKINDIKSIISQDPETYEINRFFGAYSDGQEVFLRFLSFLRTLSEVELNFKKTKIGITTPKWSFSAVKMGGPGSRKTVLQINTDIDVSNLNEDIQRDDRLRDDGKKKGSLGLERYEVYFRNEQEMKTFCNYIKGCL
jgi:hypothetical protein